MKMRQIRTVSRSYSASLPSIHSDPEAPDALPMLQGCGGFVVSASVDRENGRRPKKTSVMNFSREVDVLPGMS